MNRFKNRFKTKNVVFINLLQNWVFFTKLPSIMPKQDIPKAYEARDYEDDIYAIWEKSGFFNPDNLPGERKETFSIVLPPPNVTGTLHMGHAVMLAIEDIMVRFNRMRWRKTLWLPGTDHASIATSTKVETILYKTEGKTRHDIGREEFLRRVEKFAQDSHDTIVNQCRKMGASLDWSREAYTLDAARNTAVNTAFKKMYDDGLIYRGYRVVNWDPIGQTTLSDIEIVYKEEKAKFYYFKYGPFVIGTARPETKFGDKYVVMHPDDDRYKEYTDGQTLDLEWINGPIKATVIKDTSIDMAFGTGVMTITPWHSMVDFEIAERHGLDKEQIIDREGKLLAIAGEFAGMHITEAREKIVEKLEKKGLLVKAEDYLHEVATAERSGALVEPQIMEQWFIDVTKEFERDGKIVTIKSLTQTAVRSGAIKIIPERFEKGYFQWVDNLRDWCISRQLWYGHRIPAWYRNEEIFIGMQPPEGDGWQQDSDTLDTWFSAGIWTCSTLGWPEQTSDLSTYHPTSVLETGYDILTFWVVRMVMMTTYLLNEVPFKTVYLHGLVRDELGRKMSKSLDNIINPLDMIASYGADATRLSLVIGSTPGNDTKLSVAKVAGYRNFTNKLWNISRFVLMSVGEVRHVAESELQPKTLADRWILSQFHLLQREITDHLEAYEFSQAGEKLREFTWNQFADWYLEIAKIQKGSATDHILLYLLERLLAYWHPFMPFVTETIWKQIDPEQLLMVHEWPIATGSWRDKSAEEKFLQLMAFVNKVRDARSRYQISPSQIVEAEVKVWVAGRTLEDQKEILFILSGLSYLKIVDSIDAGGIPPIIIGDMEIYVSIEVNKDIELVKLTKERESIWKYIQSLEQKLANQEFVSKAPEQVVASMRANHEEALKKLTLIDSQLNCVAQS
ncbi:TPA: valine--tRNA ligase [Candidatus Uhrbacteria bacterium]|nr:valine--tRNA ligase [Candidatus Uhrbacteria bacterium]